MPLVEIVTWNDWVESTYVALYFSTVGTAYNVADFPHQAFLKSGQHYIRWYKAGGGTRPTPCTDSLYMFYYTNQVAAVGCARFNSDMVYVVAMVKFLVTVHVQSEIGVPHPLRQLAFPFVSLTTLRDNKLRGWREVDAVISQGALVPPYPANITIFILTANAAEIATRQVVLNETLERVSDAGMNCDCVTFF